VSIFIRAMASLGAFLSTSVCAQSPQIIITEPQSLAGRYGAVTFDVAPSAFFSATAIPQGEFFVYDYVNCDKKTFVAPVVGSVKGKVAFITDTDTACKFDDIVRLVQAEGATAVVINTPGNNVGAMMSHANPAGLTIPALRLVNGTAGGAIRDAIVKGFVVRASFQTMPYLRPSYLPVSVMPGQKRSALVSMIPTLGASINFESVDLFRSEAGLQTSGRFTSGCTGMTFSYSSADKAITVQVPSDLSYTGLCTLTYLISDSDKYEVASRIDILIGMPTAVADYAWTEPATPIALNVLENDIGDASTKDASKVDLAFSGDTVVQSVTTVQGIWAVKEGRLLFSPASGFEGLASQRYRVGGKNGGFSNEAVVRIKVGKNIPAYAKNLKLSREFYLPSRDVYFRTADAGEADFVASGGAGPWIETLSTFPVGGTNQICRFYGNTKIDPATNKVYGPQSHFYTIDQGECDALKKSYVANAKSWNFESLDFSAIPMNSDKTCPSESLPVYRVYNNGFPTKDSNHRYTTSSNDLRAMLPTGWSYEGPVFCAPFLF
jgi:Repeat of unknown function (DUF5648)